MSSQHHLSPTVYETKERVAFYRHVCLAAQLERLSRKVSNLERASPDHLKSKEERRSVLRFFVQKERLEYEIRWIESEFDFPIAEDVPLLPKVRSMEIWSNSVVQARRGVLLGGGDDEGLDPLDLCVTGSDQSSTASEEQASAVSEEPPPSVGTMVAQTEASFAEVRGLLETQSQLLAEQVSMATDMTRNVWRCISLLKSQHDDLAELLDLARANGKKSGKGGTSPPRRRRKRRDTGDPGEGCSRPLFQETQDFCSKFDANADD